MAAHSRQATSRRELTAVNLRMMKADVAFRLEQGISSNALIVSDSRIVGTPEVGQKRGSRKCGFNSESAPPVVTHAAKRNTEPDHRPNLPLFAPAYFSLSPDPSRRWVGRGGGDRTQRRSPKAIEGTCFAHAATSIWNCVRGLLCTSLAPRIELTADAVDAWPLVSPFVSEQIL